MNSSTHCEHPQFFEEMAIVNLALLWGHLPPGIIRTTRRICSRYEREAPFALARDSFTGKAASTIFHTFGAYHLQTPAGPFPVSLVELISAGPNSIPVDIVSCLHSVAIGFPVVGDNLFPKHEKFFNPVISIPIEENELALQEWYQFSESVRSPINEDRLTGRLLDGEMSRRNIFDSILPNHFYAIEHADVDSGRGYIDHPEASRVRRDRGVVF